MSLILKRASTSRISGELNDDDFDVFADGVGRPHHEGARRAGRYAMDVDAHFRLSRRPHADARLRGDARGRDGGVREELAAVQLKPTTEAEATGILPP